MAWWSGGQAAPNRLTARTVLASLGLVLCAIAAVVACLVGAIGLAAGLAVLAVVGGIDLVVLVRRRRR
ncbi:MAG TPA: hypothetical protein VHC41_08255 [Mycobacteriales bacterium]|nr:hypothetical protein [Mycobacteriales bacterium]